MIYVYKPYLWKRNPIIASILLYDQDSGMSPNLNFISRVFEAGVKELWGGRMNVFHNGTINIGSWKVLDKGAETC